jgi:hypothetical protein
MGRRALTFLIVLFLAFPCHLKAQNPEPGQELIEGLQIMPRLGVGVEYGGFARQDDSFTSRLRRRVEIDVLQYGHHIFYLQFDEETLFGTPRDKWDFNQLRYQLIIGGYRYDLGEHYLGLSYSHWCYNIFLTEKDNGFAGRTNASLYFMTLEFLKKSMRLGMKDRGIIFNPEKPFEFLGSWHYGLWVSKEIANDRAATFDLGWVLQAKLRFDILRYRCLVPYVEVAGEMRAKPSARFSPRVEAGIRYHLRDKVDLTPFFQWARNQEILLEDNKEGSRRVAQNYWYGGLRVETLIDSIGSSEQFTDGWHFLPEIHGNMGYFNFSQSRFFGWGGNIEVDLELLRYGSWTAFVYTDLLVDTKKGGSVSIEPYLDCNTASLTAKTSFLWKDLWRTARDSFSKIFTIPPKGLIWPGCAWEPKA